jgi:diaminopimelate epimerase
MNQIDAYKMDGLGNDFIIFDQRTSSTPLTKTQMVKISNRNNIGCDQIIFINKDQNNDAFLKFYNSDGGETSACGNGSRCAAYLLMKENKSKKISLRTQTATLYAELNDKNLVKINMGQPNFQWDKIPLSKKMNYKNLQIEIASIKKKRFIGGFALNVGNPHLLFFVNDLDQFNIKEIGPKIENHIYFPEKCNLTLASIKNKKNIQVKVWERGAGLTKACGTAACATVVAASILKLSDRCADIEFPQGLINIDWQSNNNIYMTGKVSEIKKIVVSI